MAAQRTVWCPVCDSPWQSGDAPLLLLSLDGVSMYGLIWAALGGEVAACPRHDGLPYNVAPEFEQA